MCCQKLVIAQKYSAKVRLNFDTRSAPSAEHYKGMFGVAFLGPVFVALIYILCLKKLDPYD